MTFVHQHAIDRFIERVEPVSREAAKAEILSHAPVIETAAAFGCQIVKLGSGARLILDGDNIVTVYGPRMLPRQLRRGAVPA